MVNNSTSANNNKSRNIVVDILPFDFENVPDNGFHLVVGKRGQGKSFLTKYLASHWPYRNEGICIVIAGSANVKADWSSCVAPLYIHDINEDIVQNLIEDQNRLVQKYKDLKVPFPNHHKKLLVIDDAASDVKFMKSAAFRYLASNSRHLQLTVYTLAQYLRQIICEIRMQFDNIFSLATSNRRNISILNDEFASMVDNRIFRSVLSAGTERYGAICINNRTASDNISNVIRFIRAPIDPTQYNRIGSPASWEYSKKHFLDVKRLRTQKESLRAKLRVHEEFEDDDCDDEKKNINNLFDDTYDLIDNRRTYQDRGGTIMIRKMPQEKKKLD